MITFLFIQILFLGYFNLRIRNIYIGLTSVSNAMEQYGVPMNMTQNNHEFGSHQISFGL